MRKLLVKFLFWRIKHLSDRNFIILLGVLVGVFAGLAAVILKQSVHLLQRLLLEGIQVEFTRFLYFLYPLMGILITVLIVEFLLKEKMGHGITGILYDISKRFSNISPRKMFSRMITSVATVGFGGSVGLEAPIVVTGSAIGSNIGQLVHLNYKNKTILIACGSAAAIAGIFNSPIAGVIFAIEVVLTDVTVTMFIPILIASVTGSLVSILLTGEDVLFSFHATAPFQAQRIPFYVLLGIFTGLFSVYFTRVMYWTEGLISKIGGIYPRAIIGGLILGVLVLLFPPLFGEGYDSIKELLIFAPGDSLDFQVFSEQIQNHGVLLLFLLATLLLKPIASAVTIGAGGSGGIFAPSFFAGGVAGFVFAAGCNYFLGTNLSTANFVLVGMCGAMSGILHAPLTAIFLIAEITSGYTLFIPLMLVSAISYNTSTYFEKYSLYTKHLIERGDLIKYDKDRQVLSQMKIRKLIETDLLRIHPDATLGDLINLVRRSHRNIFPVIDQEGALMGVVTLDDIREIMFDPESQKNVQVSALMHSAPATVDPHENMQSVMNKFEATGAWNLPVIDDGKYIGFLSKSRIFNSYRTKLIRSAKE